MKNIIILGAGRTGSSILAGIISTNGYSVSLEEIKGRQGYPDGDYENPELIKMNENILMQAGYGFKKVNRTKNVDIQAIAALYTEKSDLRVYKEFVDTCNKKTPWLWKDPRLCYTMYFWRHFLNFKNIRLIHITRDKYDIFRSYAKYKIHYTKKEIYKKYHEQEIAIEGFLTSTNAPILNIHYPEIKDADRIIEKLNRFLGTNISHDDYALIYRGNIRPHEKEGHFKVRYWWGLSKLMLGRLLRMPGSL